MKTTVSRKRILFLAEFALLLAMEIIVCFTPLGSIPITPGIVATIGHLPVIITAITLGVVPGTIMGFLMGLFSLIVWSTSLFASPVAFIFTPFAQVPGLGHGTILSLVICFVPRILVGLCAGLIYKGLSRMKHKSVASIITGLAASLIHTGVFALFVYLFFGTGVVSVDNAVYEVFIALINTSFVVNGLVEAVFGGVGGYIAFAVNKAVKKIRV